MVQTEQSQMNALREDADFFTQRREARNANDVSVKVSWRLCAGGVKSIRAIF